MTKILKRVDNPNAYTSKNVKFFISKKKMKVNQLFLKGWRKIANYISPLEIIQEFVMDFGVCNNNADFYSRYSYT